MVCDKRITAIIPARWSSTRFPGKPLALIDGVPMIERVYRQVSKAALPEAVIVAADDPRIEDCVHAFGGRAVRTSKEHSSGTDRCLEAAEINGKTDVVINIQGDEPLVDPELVDRLAGVFFDDNVQIATVVMPVVNVEDLDNPDVVKVLLDKNENAVAFSRSAIPFVRGVKDEDRLKECRFFKHMGLYAYRIDVLGTLCHLPRSSYEIAEQLEQWRFLENGYRIRAVLTNHQSHSVDVPDDIARVEALLRKDNGH